MWKSGITLRHTSERPSLSVAAMLRADAQRFACVNGTSFGREVVPDVCSSSATASAWAGVAGNGVAAGMLSVNAPAASPSSSSITRKPRLAATCRTAAGLSGATITAAAFRPSRCELNSAAFSAGFSGATAHHGAMHGNAAAMAAPLGRTMATRCCGSMPPARNTAPTRWAWARSPA